MKGSTMKRYSVRLYEGLPSDVRQTINDNFQGFFNDLKAESFGAENGDQAETLIDAMTEYFLCSNPSFRSVVFANACFYRDTGEYAKDCG